MCFRHFYDRICSLSRTGDISLCVKQRKIYRKTFFNQLFRTFVRIRAYFHKSCLAFYIRRHLYPGTPIIIQIKMSLMHNQKFHIPVNTSIKCKISDLWIYFLILAVICFHKQRILFFQHIRHICPKRCIAVIVSEYCNPI